MPIERHPPPDRRRPPNPGQQQGGRDLPARQQQGEIVPADRPNLPEPKKPDIEDPDETRDEDHYDRIV